MKRVAKLFTTTFALAVALGLTIGIVLPEKAVSESASSKDRCVKHTSNGVVVGSCDEEGWLDALADANPFTTVQSNFRDPLY